MSSETITENETVDTEAANDGQLYVTFNLGSETMALPISEVQEIVRPDEMARIPLTPLHLLGVMALRGRMLPVSSMAILLGMEEGERNKDTRVVVLVRVDGSMHGLLVDRMTGVQAIAESDIEQASDVGGESDTGRAFVSGMARLGVGDAQKVAMLLDADKLTQDNGTSRKKADRKGASAGTKPGADEDHSRDIVDDGEMRVIFGIGDEEYALGIKAVSEIISLNSHVSRLPHASDEIEGVTTLRGRVLSLVHGRVLFGLPHTKVEVGSKALEIDVGGQRVGLIVDHVSEVTRIPNHQIEETPGLLKQGRMGDLIHSICKLDGDRLVSNLNEAALLSQDVVTEAMQHAEEQEANTEAEDVGQAIERGKTMQWVVFILNGGEYAVQGAQIREIVRVPEIVSVPQAPDFVEGAIALRGRILPVISLAKRFGEAAGETTDDTKIIVAEMQGVVTGMLVDSVRAVMDISDAECQPAPEIVSGKNAIITGLAGLDNGKRIIMLLDMDRVLNDDEFLALQEVSASEAIEV